MVELHEETYFPFLEEIKENEPDKVEPTVNSYEVMISAIIVGVPDPTLTPDNSNE